MQIFIKLSLTHNFHFRAFGPFGEWLIKNFRPDLLQKYNSIVDPSIFSQYIYHCNSNTNYSGEAAFHKLAFVGPCSWSPLGHVWPFDPMGERMKNGLSDEVPVTFLYGGRLSNFYQNLIMFDVNYCK